MEREKPRGLTPSDEQHDKLMRSILKGVGGTNIVLKGGTALMFAYGLDRFSEDLDFDAPQKLNLASKVQKSIPFGMSLLGDDPLRPVKNTDSVTRYRFHYQSELPPRMLKIEVSYRTPTPESDVRVFDEVRVASLPRIIDLKLRAAHDGEKPRSKVRDLYDLNYVAQTFPAAFTPDLASRLQAFASDPDVLASRYRPDFQEDDLIKNVVADVEDIALQLHCVAEEVLVAQPEIARRVEASKCGAYQGDDAVRVVFSRLAANEIAAAEAAKGNASEANWKKVEEATIRECVGKSVSTSEAVMKFLTENSPGAATATRQNDLRAFAENLPQESVIQNSSGVSKRVSNALEMLSAQKKGSTPAGGGRNW